MVTARAGEKPSAAALAASSNDTEQPESEVTKVSARPQELYSVEVWRNGVRQTVVPVLKNEISIGRGSKSVTVDLPIKGDPEVSRSHASLERDNSGRFWFTPKGRNPAFVNGREIGREERVEVKPDEKIEIASFTLRIQPK
jgi:pSer/pThr/pTyr-binding forkhead associated (FHA) protein